MNTTMTIAMISFAIQQLEKTQNTMIEVTNSNKTVLPYIHKANKKKFKNPKLKMGHPIIQPRGQNH
jgi:hypothetical protein